METNVVTKSLVDTFKAAVNEILNGSEHGVALIASIKEFLLLLSKTLLEDLSSKIVELIESFLAFIEKKLDLLLIKYAIE